MPLFTILFGIALMAVGVGTYIGAGEGASLSALILQLILGLLALGMGVGSIVKKEMRMHLMHGAVMLAALLVLIGVVLPLIDFVQYLFKLDQAKQMGILQALLTVVFSGAYVYLAVRSFRAARKNRTNPPSEAPTEPDPQPDSTPEQ